MALIIFPKCTKESLSAPAEDQSTNDPVLKGMDESLLTLNPDGTLTDQAFFTCIDSFPLQQLSNAEIDALNAMREEELLAHDIYVSMFSLYNMPVFNNISNSELRHTSAIQALLEKYSLPDVAAEHQTGVFVNIGLQHLYDSLLIVGSASLNQALTVGATIEDLDINDLASHKTNDIDNEDITFVFNQLEKGSRNHLRSFYKLLKLRGILYTPQFIDNEYFNQIISSPHERGRV
jgi:hypothetical protein